LIPGGSTGDYLAVHGGFSNKFGFNTAADAYEYIKVMWEVSDVIRTEIAIFDWQGPARGFGYSDPTGGIFELDWSEPRNILFNQVVGHSTHYDGPIHKQYVDKQSGEITNHWNIDIGGKGGQCAGGIVIDDVAGTVEPAFWGSRKWDGANKKYHFPKADAQKKLGDSDRITIIEAINDKSKSKVLKALPAGQKEFTTDELFQQIPLVDLDDVDIRILDDPDVLAVYQEEVERMSNPDVRLLH
jgi:hypothetical protein